MYYYLYWDEGVDKLRRSVYASLGDAKAQAMHDLLCLRCRVLDEKSRPTLESTGLEPLDPYLIDLGVEVPCKDCDGSKYSPSRNILYIEESEKELGVIERERGNLPNLVEFGRGKKVWERE